MTIPELGITGDQLSQFIGEVQQLESALQLAGIIQKIKDKASPDVVWNKTDYDIAKILSRQLPQQDEKLFKAFQSWQGISYANYETRVAVEIAGKTHKMNKHSIPEFFIKIGEACRTIGLVFTNKEKKMGEIFQACFTKIPQSGQRGPGAHSKLERAIQGRQTPQTSSSQPQKSIQVSQEIQELKRQAGELADDVTMKSVVLSVAERQAWSGFERALQAFSRKGNVEGNFICDGKSSIIKNSFLSTLKLLPTLISQIPPVQSLDTSDKIEFLKNVQSFLNRVLKSEVGAQSGTQKRSGPPSRRPPPPPPPPQSAKPSQQQGTGPESDAWSD